MFFKKIILSLLILGLFTSPVHAKVTTANTSRMKTSSQFERKNRGNNFYKLRYNLNPKYDKYSIKIKIQKENGDISKEKLELFPDVEKTLTRNYNYNDIGYKAKINIKVKKYTYNVYQKPVDEVIKEDLSNNTLNVDKTSDEIIIENTNPLKPKGEKKEIVDKKPKIIYTKSVKDKKFLYKSFSRREALLNFTNNENDNIYSQSKRTIDGFMDCSAFVHLAYQSIGVNFSEHIGNTETLLHYAECNGQRVNINQNDLKIGDIIFYFDKSIKTYKKHYKHVTHVSMYVGNGEIFEYSGGSVNCRKRPIGYYESHAKARAYRVLN